MSEQPKEREIKLKIDVGELEHLINVLTELTKEMHITSTQLMQNHSKLMEEITTKFDYTIQEKLRYFKSEMRAFIVEVALKK